MERKDIILIIISGLSLIVSAIALIRDFCTRKKVQELTDLEIEKLKAERDCHTKAIVYGYIDDGFFVIENSGEAPALNIRYEGYDDWCDDITNNIIHFLPPHRSQSIELNLTKDSPSSSVFKIKWDDEFCKDHIWSNTLDLE